MINLLIDLFFIIVLTFIFFGYVLDSTMLILLFMLFLSVVIIVINKKITITKIDLTLLTFAVFCICSIVYSISPKHTISYAIGIVCLFFINLVQKTNYNKKEIVLKWLIILSSVHLFFTCLYLFNPNFVLNISQYLLNQESFTIVSKLYNNGAVAGIAEQTGTNAIYISVLIGIFYSKIISGNTKLLNVAVVFLSMFGIFLTQKRGLLLANILSIFILFFLKKNKSIKSKNRNKLFISLSLLFLMFFIFNSSLVGDFVTSLVENPEQDITSGRFTLWNSTIDYFTNKPILGHGINTITVLLGTNTHNTYIQILAELGIFGLLLLLFVFVGTFLKTLKYHRINADIFTHTSLYFQIVFIIYSLTGNPIYDFRFFILYILMCNLSYKRRLSDTSMEKDSIIKKKAG